MFVCLFYWASCQYLTHIFFFPCLCISDNFCSVLLPLHTFSLSSIVFSSYFLSQRNPSAISVSIITYTDASSIRFLKPKNPVKSIPHISLEFTSFLLIPNYLIQHIQNLTHGLQQMWSISNTFSFSK